MKETNHVKIGVILILTLLFCIGSAGATGTITVGSANAVIGETVNIPITISEITDITGFEIIVDDSVSGASIVINRSVQPLSGGTYMFSNPPLQKIFWMRTDSGLSDSNLIIFYVNVTPTQSGTIPINITITSLATFPAVSIINDYTAVNGTVTVAAAPQPPVTVSITSPAAGISFFENTIVDFTASASNFDGAVTYSWDFGDGNTGTGDATQNTYAATGSKTVTVTASGNDLSGSPATAQATLTVVITGLPTDVTLSVPQKVYLGRTGTADASVYDSNGDQITNFDGMTFQWSSSDTTILTVGDSNTSSVSLIPVAEGTATLSLQLTGTGFDISGTSQSISIEKVPEYPSGADDGAELLAKHGGSGTSTTVPTTSVPTVITTSTTQTVTQTITATVTEVTSRETAEPTSSIPSTTATKATLTIIGVLAGLGVIATVMRRK